MPPQARLLDLHSCPLHGPTPILGIGAPTVIVCCMPAARVTDFGGCVQPPSPVPIPDPIIKGSMTVIISGLLAARIGDDHTHLGKVTTGAPTVITGG